MRTQVWMVCFYSWPLSGWIYNTVTPRAKPLKFIHSSRILLPLCHPEFLGKQMGEDLKLVVVLSQSQGLTVVYEAMWRTFLLISRCYEMKAEHQLTLLGGDRVRLLLQIWDRLPLWDVWQISVFVWRTLLQLSSLDWTLQCSLRAYSTSKSHANLQQPHMPPLRF